MLIALGRPRRRVPIRALLISLAALAVPVAGALLFPDGLAEYGALLWLLALVPAFLLAYYRDPTRGGDRAYRPARAWEEALQQMRVLAGS